MSTAALIVAAGRGSRAKPAVGQWTAGSEQSLPKQYAQIGRHAVLTLTLHAFIRHPLITTVQVVIHRDDRKLYEKVGSDLALMLPGLTSLKLAQPVTGGASRQSSVHHGLAALQTLLPDKAADQPDIVLVHDAARPFVPEELITAVASNAQKYGGSIAALRLSDTLKRENADGCIKKTIDRNGLWRAQTPQGFRFTDLLAAHAAAQDAGCDDFTDDAAIAEWAGLNVRLVEGSAANIKLTTAEDLAMAARDQAAKDTPLKEAAPQIQPAQPTRPDIRTGSGFDVHRLCPGNHVWLCGVKIPHSQSLDGHSDADVGLHALTDAILGAIADGDIGAHFPPSDPKWKGASSDQFLADAAARVAVAGGVVNHVDVTIMCETPKIGPHRDAMRQAIAGILRIDLGRVAVKATTTERLGFTGRGEGIAAMATATVLLPH